MRIEIKATREEKKRRRAEQVARIVVEVPRGEAVLRFDGDETSQIRMKRFAEGMRLANRATIPWVLADNTEVEVTADELEHALLLALEAQGALWFIP